MATSDPELVLTVSFKALQRAKSTLEDFAKSYFPYLGLKLEDFFRFLDVLVWVEASIYQLDEDNEALTGRGGRDMTAAEAGITRIGQVLRQQGLWDERLEAELQAGLRYWALEQELCARLLAAPRPFAAPAPLSAEEVLRCHEAKSFDYRVLCLLLFRLSGRPYDESLLAFLRVDEMLVDMSDDLCDYEDDVLANSFNIFRCYCHVYGREAELKLVERIGSLEARHRELLAGLPAAMREHHAARHEEACEGQGSDRWVFPSPIADEADFRRRVGEEEEQAQRAGSGGGQATRAGEAGGEPGGGRGADG
ncbi:hypothetical protein HYH03_010817 [Edaphochlamys debaryana]|uniref:Uncharacterized protein n=1 Tax=Edaphochlamys debaryana TaxID=47281 RepID=A0A835XW50_9CHLO|nr:hypothetical protein HYH03_010817 [Edaphochlamys debaryana]|eukprot:KAG2490904.1 hypothetical protein HYH03_010817 [Edaphochlamys debaryana]